MILRGPQTESDAELEIRKWLQNELGVADELALSGWLWENHGRSGVAYVDALAEVARAIHAKGKPFAHALLEIAKKPKDRREAETEILHFMSPRLQKATSTVRGHRGDPKVAEQEFNELQAELMWKLRAMYNNSASFTRGAILSAFVHREGAFELVIAKLVEQMCQEDPLQTNAAASWAAFSP